MILSLFCYVFLFCALLEIERAKANPPKSNVITPANSTDNLFSSPSPQVHHSGPSTHVKPKLAEPHSSTEKTNPRALHANTTETRDMNDCIIRTMFHPGTETCRECGEKISMKHFLRSQCHLGECAAVKIFGLIRDSSPTTQERGNKPSIYEPSPSPSPPLDISVIASDMSLISNLTGGSIGSFGS